VGLCETFSTRTETAPFCDRRAAAPSGHANIDHDDRTRTGSFNPGETHQTVRVQSRSTQANRFRPACTPSPHRAHRSITIKPLEERHARSPREHIETRAFTPPAGKARATPSRSPPRAYQKHQKNCPTREQCEPTRPARTNPIIARSLTPPRNHIDPGEMGPNSVSWASRRS